MRAVDDLVSPSQRRTENEKEPRRHDGVACVTQQQETEIIGVHRENTAPFSNKSGRETEG